jgi:hypothetical protein
MELSKKYYDGSKPIIEETNNLMKTDVIVPYTGKNIVIDSVVFSENATFKKSAVFEGPVQFSDDVLFMKDSCIKNAVFDILKPDNNIVQHNTCPFILGYGKDYDDVSNLTGEDLEVSLIFPPKILSSYCIFYLVVLFNNGISYCKNKFYYKSDAKISFEILNKENINCDENKASIKYIDGKLKINLKFNKNTTQNIKIKVFYSDV